MAGCSLNVVKDVEEGGLCALLLRIQLVQPLWETVKRFLKNLKIELPSDPAIPLLGIYLKEMKTGSARELSTPVYTAVLLTTATAGKQPHCPSTGEWIRCDDTFIFIFVFILM